MSRGSTANSSLCDLRQATRNDGGDNARSPWGRQIIQMVKAFKWLERDVDFPSSKSGNFPGSHLKGVAMHWAVEYHAERRRSTARRERFRCARRGARNARTESVPAVA